MHALKVGGGVIQQVVCGSSTQSYQCNPMHRNGTDGKSQWDISYKDEILSFADAITKGWHADGYAWSVFPPHSPTYVGRDRDHTTPVFIARFEATSTPPVWHGYPVNHKKSKQRPPVEITRAWLDDNVFSPAKIRKIARGEPCDP